MGYLHIPSSSLTNFSKAVISLWFRIPAATLLEVSSLTDTPVGETSDAWNGVCFDPPLYKIIPLITFGSLEVGLGDALGVNVQPSFIGVDCSSLVSGKTGPTLAVNLQTTSLCTFNKTPVDPESEMRPECYYMGGAGRRMDASDFQEARVIADEWHHALISFDISPECSILWAGAQRSPPDPTYVLTGGPTFTWSLNDVDKTGPAMFRSGGANWTVTAPPTTSGTTLADNQIIPQALFAYFGSGGNTSSFPVETSTDFEITVPTSVIASNGNPIGIPTSAAFVDNVHKVDLADLQIFTGIYADAGSEVVRRFFISPEGTPVNPAVAQSGLGQAPAIIFNSGTNWRAGTNTGSLGGTFTKVGTVNNYSPFLGLP